MAQIVVFVTPHQDDETLSMGEDIRLHLQAGDDVHVLLQTTGQNSGVFPSTGLTVADFIAARDDEMARATRQLGVRSANVHISPLATEDGQLTVADAQAQLAAFFLDYPTAWVKTYSNRPAPGRHPDHVASGQAALNLYHAGLFDNLRMYVEPWPTLLAAFRTANPTVALGVSSGANLGAVQRGFDEYKAEDGVAAKYGIGHQSVGAEFDAMRPTPTSYWHVPVGV